MHLTSWCYKPEWMLGWVEVWLIGFSNHNIKKFPPGFSLTQRILTNMSKEQLKGRAKNLFERRTNIYISKLLIQWIIYFIHQRLWYLCVRGEKIISLHFKLPFHEDSQQNFINKEWNIYTETCITLLVIYITIYKACN